MNVLTRGQRTLLLLLPAVVYIAFLFVPLAVMIRMSLREYGSMTGLRDVVSFETYLEILSQPAYLQTWLRTMQLSITTALIATVLGTTVALVMWRVGGRFRAYFTVLVLAPLFISGVARSFGWIAVASPSGLLPTITEALGFGDGSFMFSRDAVIVGFVNVLLPYVVLTVIVRLDSIQPSWLRASASLGSSTLQTLGRVVLPIVLPAVVAAVFITFALATTSYAVPAVLGGGRVDVIATQVVLEQRFNFNLPKAAALSVLMTVLALLVLGASQLLRRGRRRTKNARARLAPPTLGGV